MTPAVQTASTTASTVRSIYRSLLRETRKLPYGYLRVFFRLKFRDDIRSDIRSTSQTIKLSDSKRNRLGKELKRLKAANSGKSKAFNRILDFAYGRRGKLKWELLEPFLSNGNAETPPPIIGGVETSRPPAYSPELTALLTSSSSRTTKPLKGTDLATPPILPPRANSESKEAKLLGPFSKRREVNMRWRYYATETRKVLPPLEISSQRTSQASLDNVEVSESSRRSDILERGLAESGFQDSGVLHEIQRLAGVWNKSRTLTKRERRMFSEDGGGLKSEVTSGVVSENINASSALPTKFLRRRHRHLLNRIPVLRWIEQEANPSSDAPGRAKGKYDVSLPHGALSRTLISQRLPLAGENNMAWIRLAQELEGQQNSTTEKNQ